MSLRHLGLEQQTGSALGMQVGRSFPNQNALNIDLIGCGSGKFALAVPLSGCCWRRVNNIIRAQTGPRRDHESFVNGNIRAQAGLRCEHESIVNNIILAQAVPRWDRRSGV